MTTTMIVAIVLFAVTYVLLFALPKFKPYIALASAVVFSVWLAIDKSVDFTFSTFINAIDFNVLMMIAGTMGIVSLFIESKMPMRIADVTKLCVIPSICSLTIKKPLRQPRYLQKKAL